MQKRGESLYIIAFFLYIVVTIPGPPLIEWSEPIPPTDAVDVAKGCRRLQQPQLVLYLVAGNQLVPVRLKPPVTKGVGCLPGMHWAPGVSVRTLENGYKYRLFMGACPIFCSVLGQSGPGIV